MKRSSKQIIVTTIIVSTIVFSFSGCGNTTSPAVGKDVVVENNEESMVEGSIEGTKESSGDNVTAPEATESEIIDSKVAGGDKPAETSSPTATPTPTSTPEPTATPEPTPTPHVHEYAENITVQPTCAMAGEKKLTCSCGDTKTESIPASGEHNWVEQTQIVHHDEVGSIKTVQVGTNKRTVYYCLYCYQELGLREEAFSSDNQADITNHQLEEGQAILDAGGTLDEARKHAIVRGFCIDYYDPVYEEQYIVQSPAYDETIVTGYICSVCGATK